MIVCDIFNDALSAMYFSLYSESMQVLLQHLI